MCCLDKCYQDKCCLDEYPKNLRKEAEKDKKEKKKNEHKNVKCVKQETPHKITLNCKNTENEKNTNMHMMQKNSK